MRLESPLHRIGSAAQLHNAEWEVLVGDYLPALYVLAGLFSAACLGYSVRLLFRTGQPTPRTSSIAMTRISPKHFLLDLIALSEPAVKALLSPPPEELRVSIRANSEGEHEAM